MKIQPHGDAGELTNKLVLTKDDPIADGVFGIDNTFASRAVDEGVLDEVHVPQRPRLCARFDLCRRRDATTSPRSTTATCASTSTTPGSRRRSSRRRRRSTTWPSPPYRDLLVTPGATSSSPGLAFLLATIGHYGDGWKDYWTKLVDNGLKIDAGW